MLASSPNITHSAEKSLHCFASITAASIVRADFGASLSEERAEGWRVVWVDPGPPLSPQCAWAFKEPRPPAPLRGGVLRLLRGARSAFDGETAPLKRIPLVRSTGTRVISPELPFRSLVIFLTLRRNPNGEQS
jgi:hypothetical protein